MPHPRQAPRPTAATAAQSRLDLIEIRGGEAHCLTVECDGVQVKIDKHTDFDAAIEQALDALAQRDIGKPLAQCTPEELKEAFEGMDFDIPVELSDEGRANFTLLVSRRLKELGVQVADRTLHVSEHLEPDEDYEGNAPAVQYEQTLDMIYVLLQGKRIAYRGQHGTPQAKTWVSIDADYTVRDTDDLTAVEITYQGVRVQ